MSVQLKGLNRMLANLKTMPPDMALAAEAGLFEAGSLIQGDAQEIVPVDQGPLRASAFTITQTLSALGSGAQPTGEARSLAKNTATEIRAVVGFGGPSAPYALKVHENPRSGKTGGIGPKGQRYKHWAATGEWKFLHKAVQKNASRVPVIVAAHLGRVKPRGPA